MFKTIATAAVIAISATSAMADLATDLHTCSEVRYAAEQERREVLRSGGDNPEYAEASAAYGDAAADYRDIAKVYDAEAYMAAAGNEEVRLKVVADFRVATIKGEMTPAAYKEILNNCAATFTAHTADIVQ